MNRGLLIGLAAAVVIALVVAGLAIGGVFGGGDDNKKSDTTAQTTSTPTTSTATQSTPPPAAAMPTPPKPSKPSSSGGFPSTFKSQFVQGCSQSGRLSSSQCRCIINKAENAYSLPEFISAVRRSRSGTVPPKLRNIFISCA
jgi:hypothetical protein